MRVGMLGMLSALMAGSAPVGRTPVSAVPKGAPRPKRTRLFWGRYWDAAKEQAARELTKRMKKYEVYTRQQRRRADFELEFQKVTSEVDAPRAVRRRIARNRLRLAAQRKAAAA